MLTLEQMLGEGLRLLPQQVDPPRPVEWVMAVDQIEDPTHGYQCGDRTCRSGIYIGNRALVVPHVLHVGATSQIGDHPQGSKNLPSYQGTMTDAWFDEDWSSTVRWWDALPITAEEAKAVTKAYESVISGEFVGRMREIAEVLVGDYEFDPQVLEMETFPGTENHDAWCEEYAKRSEERLDMLMSDAETDLQSMEQARVDTWLGLDKPLQKKWRDLQMVSRKAWVWVEQTYPEECGFFEKVVFSPWY